MMVLAKNQKNPLFLSVCARHVCMHLYVSSWDQYILEPINNGRFIKQFSSDTKKLLRQIQRINKKYKDKNDYFV